MTDAMTKLEPMLPNEAPRPSPEKIFPVSWDQFHRDSRALAWRLSGGGRAFEAIVCITRGGLVPAAIVARELGIRLIETVCVSSYDHTTQGNLIVLKEVAPAIVARGGGDGGSVLIVDDLVDTGQTAKVVRGLLAARAPRHRLRQAHGPAAGRHLHHRGLPGHLDLFSLGHRACFPAADPRGRPVAPAPPRSAIMSPTSKRISEGGRPWKQSQRRPRKA